MLCIAPPAFAAEEADSSATTVQLAAAAVESETTSTSEETSSSATDSTSSSQTSSVSSKITADDSVATSEPDTSEKASSVSSTTSESAESVSSSTKATVSHAAAKAVDSDSTPAVSSESATSDSSATVEPVNSVPAQDQASISYATHVQDVGWTTAVADGAQSGTTGKSKRVEAVSIKVSGMSGGVEYATHIQDIGWTDAVCDGAVSGTTGKSKRAEAITIKLTGAIADAYDVVYRVHVQDIGWMGWVSNGAIAGTTGRSMRVEALEVKLVHRQTELSSDGLVTYSSYEADYGWQNAASDGEETGSTGQSKAIEGIRIAINSPLSGSISYQTHVSDIGWQGVVSDGAVAGAPAQHRVEAVKINLSDDLAQTYDVVYRAHVQNIGWLDWVSNGAVAGTTGQGLQIEALQVMLVKKPVISYSLQQASNPPSNSSSASGIVLTVDTNLAGSAQYRVRDTAGAWSSWTSAGGLASASNGSMQAVEMKLTGVLADAYNLAYATYFDTLGWLGWAKDGAIAGEEDFTYPLRAVKVEILAPGTAIPANLGSSSLAYVDGSTYVAGPMNGVDISHYQENINIGSLDASFVVAKATEGTTYVDSYFTSYANAVLSSGKLLGAYHFARTGDAVTQANHFVSEVSAYLGHIVLALDWETTSVVSQGVNWAKTWLDTVYGLTGVRPLIYMSRSVAVEYDWSSVAKDYQLWGARYANYDPTGYKDSPWGYNKGWGAWNTPTLFQYSDNGQVSGYSGSLDIDKFYGSSFDWLALESRA